MSSTNELIAEQSQKIAHELGQKYPDLERVTMIFTWKQANQESFLVGASTPTSPSDSVDPVTMVKTLQQIYKMSEHLNGALHKGLENVELQMRAMVEHIEALRRQHEQEVSRPDTGAAKTTEIAQAELADAISRGQRVASQAKTPDEPFAP
jgi:tRNA U34 5-carboxymethylaminomethyl modifying GTPase MnmE/TrmE